MGKSKDSGLSGLLGDIISIRKIRGQIIVKARKPRRKSTSELVAKVHYRFRIAAWWAKAQSRHPVSRAIYEKGVNKKKHTPYLVALADYLTPPKVDSIDASDYKGNIGDPIIIDAWDDFMVTKLDVEIFDSSNQKIENGEAYLMANAVTTWQYEAKVANKSWAGTRIKATASDRPGNIGALEVTV